MDKQVLKQVLLDNAQLVEKSPTPFPANGAPLSPMTPGTSSPMRMAKLRSYLVGNGCYNR